MKPIAITMGDPAGIGPEIAVAAMRAGAARRAVLVVGDHAAMARAAAGVVEIAPIARAEEAAAVGEGRLAVLQAGAPLAQAPAYGRVSAEAGRAAAEAVTLAASLAKAGAVDAMVTAPIHKEALAAAGVSHPGHTEMLAEIGGAPGKPADVAMMLANHELRVVLATIHLALVDAIRAADHAAQLRAIRLADAGARAFGVAAPRIAVAGLNPHAGEGGLFGREEIEIIAPAIAEARASGLDVTGPWPGDTVFMQAREGRFDVVVAQYHDQGLIPVKYLGLAHGVNVTLGLPFIRTSPDHGTAFDIAGAGVADPASLVEAVRVAERLADARL